MRPIITEYQHISETLVASDIARPEVKTVFKSDDLDYTLKLFGTNNVDQLPVVSRNEPLKAIGTIWRDDVIKAYNQESFKHNLTDELAQDLRRIEKSSTSKVADGYSIIEKKAITKFIGKTLVQLRLRNNYGLEVLMIKQTNDMFADDINDTNIIMPDPDYVIREGDVLVLFGADDKINKTKSW